ncbi:MAG: BON domain-containing protein [Burkholderiaceae bacterium]|nr:BON domain-containing protein [Burkholderiaceae bacterium]
MKNPYTHIGQPLALICSLTLLLGLTACNKADDRTAGQKLDAAVVKSEQAAVEAGREVKEAVASTEAAAKNVAQGAKATAQNAGSVIADKIDDAAITASVSAGLAKDPDLSAIRITVETKDGAVTLQGPAASTRAKERATAIAASVKGVTSVRNMLSVKAG